MMDEKLCILVPQLTRASSVEQKDNLTINVPQLYNRFNPKDLPSFDPAKDSLDIFFKKISADVARFGETVVCQNLGKFAMKEQAQDWYLALPSAEFDTLNSGGPGCWALWMAKLASRFGGDVAMNLKDKAKARCKKHSDSWGQFVAEKLRLIRVAFPNDSEKDVCAMVRHGLLDPAADAWLASSTKIAKLQSAAYGYDTHCSTYAWVLAGSVGS